MTEHPPLEELMAWQDREVPMPRAAEIAAHVGDCAACNGEVRRLAAASAALQRWRVEPPPAATPPASDAAAPRATRRRLLYWAAAAVILVGLLGTVRVECAAGPTCDHPRFHFSFLPSTPSAFSTDSQGAMSGAAEAAFERDWNARRHLPIGIPSEDAKVLVVMFIDWQCPACRAVDTSYLPVVDAINRTNPGAVRVVTRDYPLNMRCNPNVPVEMHPAACEAAVAVRLARETHRENEMIAWLFARQPTLTPAIVQQGAKDVAGITDFAARYPDVIKQVAADVELGRRMEVGGTPTVFVNGVLARTAENALFSPQQFEQAIRLELKK